VNNADDIVDVLLDQHRQLRQLRAQVHAASCDGKKRLFGDLAVVMRAHERGEQAVVRPVTRDHTQRGGDVIAGVCAEEEERARWAIVDLQHLSVDHPSFTAKFAAFHQALLDHAAREERDEFPRLRDAFRRNDCTRWRTSFATSRPCRDTDRLLADRPQAARLASRFWFRSGPRGVSRRRNPGRRSPVSCTLVG
jgi:hypothetical protein